ncbi:MAG: hypothetical protein IJO38_09475 [Akkermansia sp.]|nr:hypothetical protein [Akkermansia sp.]
MINILNVNSPRENAMAFFPELDGARRSEVDMKQLATQHADVSDKVRVQMAVSGNTLNPTNATLWASVADSVVDAVSKKYVDMRRFAYAQASSVALPAGVSATVHVPVLTGAGEALVNTTNWDVSALTQNYVPVKADRLSRPAAIDSYDMANGEKLEQKLAACVEAVVAGCWKKMGAAVAASLPENITATTAATATKAGVYKVAADTWGPETVAKELSVLYGDFGQPDVLALSPTLYGSLVPTNALSLNPATAGVYGIGHIAMGAGLGACATGGAAKGVCALQRGLGVGTMLPQLDDFTVIATRYLGEVHGIPILLKVWSSPGTETLRISAETYFGAAVLAPQFVTVLV